MRSIRTRSSTQSRRIATAALTAGVAVLVALPVVEIATRALGVAPAVGLIDLEHEDSVYKRSTNPILGFELKANYRNPDADLFASYPFTNSWGQRDVERELEKPPGRRRVLLLGASVVEGFGIRDLDETIGRRLERLYGDGTEVLNFGVSAYCTRAKVELLLEKGLPFAPDEVVLVFTVNDFNNFNHEAFQLGSPVERAALVEWLFRHSHAFRFLATRLNLFYYGAQADPVEWNRQAIGDDNVVEGFRILRELAVEHGFAPVIAIWPRFTDDAIADVNPMPGGEGELVVERLARMNGLPSFRFSEWFERDAELVAPTPNPRVTYTLGDWIHPNGRGCEIAAAALASELGRLPERWTALRDRAPASRDQAAVTAARTLGEREPEHERIVVNLGSTLLSQGRIDEAIEQFQEALRLKPDFAEAHNNLGLALKARGDLDGAVMSYLRALRIDEELADVHNNLGVALALQGDIENAVRAFGRAVELRPEWIEARRNLELALQEWQQQRSDP